jgi:hypothetical protein
MTELVSSRVMTGLSVNPALRQSCTCSAVVEDGTKVIAIWAKHDPGRPMLAIIGAQTDPDADPWERSYDGLVINARRLNLNAEELVDPLEGVVRWTRKV